MPADFGNLLGVDYLPGGDTSTKFTLYEFSWAERNDYRNTFRNFSYAGTSFQWRILGNNLRIAPVPAGSSDILTVHYVPEFVPLALDTDVLLTELIFDEFIVTYAAIRALDKEESDSGALRANLAELTRFIKQFGESRQIAQPRQISVVEDDYMGQTTSNRFSRYGDL